MSDFRARYGPWALVTGASEGIGECFARLLAARGLHVVALARRAGPLEKLAAELRAAHGVEVRTVSADVGRPDVVDVVEAAAGEPRSGSSCTTRRIPHSAPSSPARRPTCSRCST